MGATGPSRFGAFYRGVGDAGTGSGVAPDNRFIDDTRITLHNMGTNAAGEMLFYPDPPSFFFESAFLNQETKDLTNRSLVFIFPRTVEQPNPVAGCNGNPLPNDLLAPGPCNRRQDNIFDTGNGYLTANPLQLWRIMFVTWDGPDVETPQCQAKIAELIARNGADTEGTPVLLSLREVLDVAGPDVIAGQGAEQVLLTGVLPASGLPNPDPRNDLPGVEPGGGRTGVRHGADPPPGRPLRESGPARRPFHAGKRGAGRPTLRGLTDPHRPPCGVYDVGRDGRSYR